MPIVNYDASKEVYYTERFKALVRSQKEFLLRYATTITLTNRNRVYAFKNDFYRLLRDNKVPQHLWWTVAFLNGIEDPNQDITGLHIIYNVDQSVLDKCLVRSNTKAG